MYYKISSTAPIFYLEFGDWYINHFVPQHVQFYRKRCIVSYGNFPGTEKLFQRNSTCGTHLTYFYEKRSIVSLIWLYSGYTLRGYIKKNTHNSFTHISFTHVSKEKLHKKYNKRRKYKEQNSKSF